ncbi:pyroglutamyl-peptidase I [Thalassobacillus pellis]|uniref:pyroglutamyl-peptidase I n=1 Tax=Thalassobacillus pellis TaxID=748008 RepID=UPI0019614E7A|nr:pyroglutamyl-peptidase I [Thalassobacillus pellis]MBM7551721.1 pyroglutamyl-peptidase [Thalassobacillus pellis]
MKKILLTGFEPFLDFPVNPTMQIAEELDGEKMNNHEIISRVLPVDFQKAGKELLTHIEETNPEIVIALGLAGGRPKITPERIAINCNDGPVDNRGHKPDGERICSEGPDGLFSTLPIKEITAALNGASFPAEISNSAGAYLCNNVMYHVLYHFHRKKDHKKAGFIHIPASHELAIKHGNIPSWSQQDLTAAIRLSIQITTDTPGET